MKKILTTCLFFYFGFALLAQTPEQTKQEETHVHSANSNHYFIKNQKQWDTRTRYRTSIGGMNTLFLEQQAFTYVIANPDDAASLHDAHHGIGPERPLRLHAYQVQFKNSSLVTFEEGGKQTQYHNYFLGDQADQWATKIPLFNKITYKELYPGIDLKTYSSHGHFKYDFIIEAGVSPGQIQLAYEGVDGLRIENGNLIIQTSVESIIESKPFAYQMINGEPVEVACQYQLEDRTVSYVFPNAYDTSKKLIIDPEVIASTLSGMDVTYNFGHSATYDNDGNIYASGRSYGFGYPTTMGAYQVDFGGGAFDIAVTKYNPEGTSQIYATYLGGGSEDAPHSMIVNSDDQLLILGTTLSGNFPNTDNAFQPDNAGDRDIIISKLSADGTALLASTYVGGSGSDGINLSTLNSNYDDHFKGEIVLDSDDNIYVASCSVSADFPTTEGAYDTLVNEEGDLPQDAVVFKMDSDLSVMTWSTYLGGSEADAGFSLRVDDAGKVYITGYAGGNDFPTTAGAIQEIWPGGEENAYVSVLSATGTELVASTFWGSTGDEHSFFLDIGEDDVVHIFGQTTGEIPITPGVFFQEEGSRQFISAFTPELNEIVYSTVIGNGPMTSNYDFVPNAFMIDKCNYIYLSGYYADPGLPLTTDAITMIPGSFYIGVLEPLATGLEFGTYYGEADHVDGGTSRFDKSGVIYQAVCSCTNGGNVLNTLPGAFAESQVSFCDVGVFKLDFTINAVTAKSQVAPSRNGCAPFEVSFSYTGQNGELFSWDFDDGNTASEANPTHVFEETGTYNVQLVVSNPIACNITDTLNLTIEVNINLDVNSTITDASNATAADGIISIENIVGGEAPYDFEWSTGETSTTIEDLIPGVYELTITDAVGCGDIFSFEVGVMIAVQDFDDSEKIWLSPGMINSNQSSELRMEGSYQGRLDYMVYDLQGRQISSGNFIKNGRTSSQSIEGPNTPGIYFIQIMNEEKNKRKVLELVVL